MLARGKVWRFVSLQKQHYLQIAKNLCRTTYLNFGKNIGIPMATKPESKVCIYTNLCLQNSDLRILIGLEPKYKQMR